MISLVRRITIGLLLGVALCFLILLLPVRSIRRMTMRKPVFSLWTGAPIVNMAINARAERLLGCDSKSLVTHTYYITDAFDYDLSKWRSIPILGYIVSFVIFVWVCLRVDRLHFYCDRGILPSHQHFTFNFLELWIYRWLAIPVFLWTYGADVRSRVTTRALGEPNCCTDCTRIGEACICDERDRVANVEKLGRLATAIFSMGDMIEYTPGSRNDVFFWPVDLDIENGEKYRPAFPQFDGARNVRIVHAPNHRMFKGTRFLQQAVAELRNEGVPVELVLVEKIPNVEALAIYRSADIIFDQCLVGFHGFFALEGMALGKPVMCFIRKPREYLLQPEECPLINIHPTTLKQDILNLVNDPARLASIGRDGRRYIEKYFTMDAFARRLEKAYRDLGIPPCT